MRRLALRTLGVAILPIAALFCYAGVRVIAPLNQNDYTIYSVCLRETFPSGEDPEAGWPEYNLVVNADVGSEHRPAGSKGWLRWAALLIWFPFRSDPRMFGHAAWDLHAKTAIGARIEPRLSLSRSYALTNDKELHAIYWSRNSDFDRKYPENLGWVEFSRIGYSFDGTEAALYVDHQCGLCGEGRFIRLQRDAKGSWRIVQVQSTWIS